MKVTFANVLMKQNLDDYSVVKALAEEVGAGFSVDPTITLMMDGDRSILDLNIDEEALRRVVRDTDIIDEEDFCAPPAGPFEEEDAFARVPCSAGHSSCYMEGNMRGPSTQDCEKSFARTGLESVNLKSKKPRWSRVRTSPHLSLSPSCVRSLPLCTRLNRSWRSTDRSRWKSVLVLPTADFTAYITKTRRY